MLRSSRFATPNRLNISQQHQTNANDLPFSSVGFPELLEELPPLLLQLLLAQLALLHGLVALAIGRGRRESDLAPRGRIAPLKNEIISSVPFQQGI